MPNWVFIILCSLAVTLIILCILQIVWVRVKVSSFHSTSLKKELSLKQQVVASMSATNYLQVYSVLIDTWLTRELNNPSHTFSTTIRNEVAPRKFSLPYVCSTKYASLDVDCNGVGFIVMQRSDGSSRIIQDIRNGEVRYVLIQNKVYVAYYEEDAVNGIKDHLSEVYDTLKERDIIMIYALTIPQNFVYEPADGSKCSMSLSVFMGSLSGISEMVSKHPTAINVDSVIGQSSLSRVAMHILGYKISS